VETAGSQLTCSLNNLAREVDGASLKLEFSKCEELKRELETASALRMCRRSNWKHRHVAGEGDRVVLAVEVLPMDEGSASTNQDGCLCQNGAGADQCARAGTVKSAELWKWPGSDHPSITAFRLMW